jgi:hypothetical protein
MNKGKATYVGQSTNIFNRLGTHIGNNTVRTNGGNRVLNFDRIRIYYCEWNRLRDLERELIRKYKPDNNIYRLNNRKLREQEMLNILKQFPVFWEKGGAKAPNQGMRRF